MQDNYVVQWGDATEKKALPEGLVTVPETEYVVSRADAAGWSAARAMRTSAPIIPDPYASSQALWGWPVGRGKDGELWPVHRSEERRVGKECVVRLEFGGGCIIKKKKMNRNNLFIL